MLSAWMGEHLGNAGVVSNSFLPVNFNKLKESKCYFLGNLFLLVLVMKLPLTTSTEEPGLTPGHG